MNRCTNKSSIPGDAAHLMRADTLRIAGVVKESIVDGPGIRFTVFCQGCPHACPGCHNTQTHDFDGGFLLRSEERRVGKECRSRWSPYH